AAVPGGPSIGSGAGPGAMTHRVVTTSVRSQMWSECRWGASTAESCAGNSRAAARRMAAPRPASTRTIVAPARTRVDGPARSGSGIGLPVPRTVTCTSGPGDEVGDHAGQLGPAVLLEEVPAALDGGVGLARGARHPAEEH